MPEFVTHSSKAQGVSHQINRISDHSLKALFDSTTLPKLCLSVLLPCTSTWLCDYMFSILAYIKSKYLSYLLTVEDLLLAVSGIEHDVLSETGSTITVSCLYILCVNICYVHYMHIK